MASSFARRAAAGLVVGERIRLASSRAASHAKSVDWNDDAAGRGRDYLRRATQVKNIWIPYGE